MARLTEEAPEATPAARRTGSVRQARRLSVSMLAKAWQDRILGLSAEAGFWQLLSLPPLLLAVLGSIGYIGNAFGPGTVDEVESKLIDLSGRIVAPDVVAEIVKPTLEQILRDGRADVISIGFLLSLWAGSTAMATFVNTISIAYDMRELRSAVRSRLLALGLYLVAVLVGVLTLPVLVIGPSTLIRLAPEGGARDLVGDLVRIGYWPLVVLLLLASLTSLYHLAPPIRLPWRRGVPGAVLAMLVFVLGSYGLRLYVVYVVSGALTYGTLAAPIAALLFFFVLALAILLGAELNAAIERTWPTPRRERRRWRGARGPGRRHRTVAP